MLDQSDNDVLSLGQVCCIMYVVALTVSYRSERFDVQNIYRTRYDSTYVRYVQQYELSLDRVHNICSLDNSRHTYLYMCSAMSVFSVCTQPTTILFQNHMAFLICHYFPKPRGRSRNGTASRSRIFRCQELVVSLYANEDKPQVDRPSQKEQEGDPFDGTVLEDP